jgi:hypothetical protein
MEYGPYVYREYDVYSEPEEWDIPLNLPGEKETRNAIKMILNQKAIPDTAKTTDPDLDSKLDMINQAGFGYWYMATHMPDWRIYLNVRIDLV